MTKNYWTIEELSEKKLYAVPFTAALMFVACAKPTTKTLLFEYLISKLNIHIEQLENILKSLISKNIIITADKQENYHPIFDNFLNWIKAGWGDAANYHFFTWDAPFLDYSKEGGGHDIDRKKMVNYQNLEQDISRYKEYARPIKNIPLPSLNFSESIKLSQDFTFSQKIKYLLSITFGKKGKSRAIGMTLLLSEGLAPQVEVVIPQKAIFYLSTSRIFKRVFITYKWILFRFV